MLNQITQDSFSVNFRDGIANIFPEKVTKIALLVSSEYEGYYKNGGIGTFYKTLSQRLDADGWHVILLLGGTEERFQGKSKIPVLKQVFSVVEIEQILNLQPLHYSILAEAKSDYYDYQSFCILFFTQSLLARCPDAQIYAEFSEMSGFGYRTIQAKQVGLIPRCVTSVTLHSGHEWIDEANGKFTVPYPQYFWQVCHVEQNSFENADLGFHPSDFMREKVKSYGWNTERAIRLPYFVPSIQASTTINPAIQSIQKKLAGDKIPIVFFARLEERKGLCTFIQAVKSLEPNILDRCHLIFLGKVIPLQSDRLKHLDSQQYIEQELGDSFSYDICPNFFSAEALDLISSVKSAVVCLTSPQDNFPNSALEVGQLPVSIIAADVGGFRETLGLLERSSSVHWFQAENIRSLTQVLSSVLSKYPESPQVPTPDFLIQLNQSLLDRRTGYIEQAANRSITKISPLVTINVFCVDGDLDLLECLTSLQQQTYRQHQIVVVDVAIETAETKELLGLAQTKFPEIKFVRIEQKTDLKNLQSWLTLIQQTDWVLFWRANDIAAFHLLETLILSAGTAEASVALCPVSIESQQPQVPNLRTGFVTQLLLSNQRNRNLLLSTKLLDRVNWQLDFSIDDLTKYLMVIVITTGEKIAYFPYPLYWTKDNPAIFNEDASLRASYQMRQYVASVEPSFWNPRQLYMLKTGIQQIAFRSGATGEYNATANHSFKSLAGYGAITLLKASAWKIAKKSYHRISKYEDIKIIAAVKRKVVKFFSDNTV